MENDVIINVEHLSKMYKLYNRQRDRVKDALGFGKKESLYKEHYALKDVSMQVHKGETVGIIGTNGSGKSTILKIITGVLSPTSGEVEINGRISALLELGAGFNMEFTGIENVYLNGTMNGFSEEEIDERLEAILDFADIGECEPEGKDLFLGYVCPSCLCPCDKYRSGDPCRGRSTFSGRCLFPE